MYSIIVTLFYMTISFAKNLYFVFDTTLNLYIYYLTIAALC